MNLLGFEIDDDLIPDVRREVGELVVMPSGREARVIARFNWLTLAYVNANGEVLSDEPQITWSFKNAHLLKHKSAP